MHIVLHLDKFISRRRQRQFAITQRRMIKSLGLHKSPLYQKFIQLKPAEKAIAGMGAYGYACALCKTAIGLGIMLLGGSKLAALGLLGYAAFSALSATGTLMLLHPKIKRYFKLSRRIIAKAFKPVQPSAPASVLVTATRSAMPRA